MKKARVIRNLKMAKRVSPGFFRPMHEGIYQNEKGFYLTFCHGGEDGTLALEVASGWYDVTPANIREVISKVADFNIPKDAILYITPCYPKQVTELYHDELRENNVRLFGTWDTLTCLRFINTKKGTGFHRIYDVLDENEEVAVLLTPYKTPC